MWCHLGRLRSFGFYAEHCIVSVVADAYNPSMGRLRQMDQKELKVILGYTPSFKTALDM